MFFGQEVHYYMAYIACCTELNWQFCNYAAKRRICRENSKYAFDEKVYGHFCPQRKAAIFCHPRQKQNNIPVLVNVFFATFKINMPAILFRIFFDFLSARELYFKLHSRQDIFFVH